MKNCPKVRQVSVWDKFPFSRVIVPVVHFLFGWFLALLAHAPELFATQKYVKSAAARNLTDSFAKIELGQLVIFHHGSAEKNATNLWVVNCVVETENGHSWGEYYFKGKAIAGFQDWATTK